MNHASIYFPTHSIVEIWPPVTTGCLQTLKECSRGSNEEVMAKLKPILRSKTNTAKKDSPNFLNSGSDNVFITPTKPKAWRAEELERDLLSSKNESIHSSGSSWPQIPNHHNVVNKAPSPRFINNLNKVLTREEVERQLHSDMRMRFPGNVPNFPPPRLIPPALQSAMISPIGSARANNINAPNHSSPVPLQSVRGPLIRNNCPVPEQFFMNARMNMMLNQQPMRGPLPNLPPGFNPSNLNMNHSKLATMPPRSIAHPLLNKYVLFMKCLQNGMLIP
ncbi:protein PAT1 1 [Trichonephila clavipes]|nr:protein PAT1 1 [Trichonephila clavipes]